MKKRTSIILSLIIFSLLNIECKCLNTYTRKEVKKLYSSVDYIVQGHLIKRISKKGENQNSTMPVFDVLLKIDSIYKGKFETDTLILLNSQGSCAVEFIDNQQYIIYSNGVNENPYFDFSKLKTLNINKCNVHSINNKLLMRNILKFKTVKLK